MSYGNNDSISFLRSHLGSSDPAMSHELSTHINAAVVNGDRGFFEASLQLFIEENNALAGSLVKRFLPTRTGRIGIDLNIWLQKDIATRQAIVSALIGKSVEPKLSKQYHNMATTVLAALLNAEPATFDSSQSLFMPFISEICQGFKNANSVEDATLYLKILSYIVEDISNDLADTLSMADTVIEEILGLLLQNVNRCYEALAQTYTPEILAFADTVFMALNSFLRYMLSSNKTNIYISFPSRQMTIGERILINDECQTMKQSLLNCIAFALGNQALIVNPSISASVFAIINILLFYNPGVISSSVLYLPSWGAKSSGDTFFSVALNTTQQFSYLYSENSNSLAPILLTRVVSLWNSLFHGIYRTFIRNGIVIDSNKITNKFETLNMEEQQRQENSQRQLDAIRQLFTEESLSEIAEALLMLTLLETGDYSFMSPTNYSEAHLTGRFQVASDKYTPVLRQHVMMTLSNFVVLSPLIYEKVDHIIGEFVSVLFQGNFDAYIIKMMDDSIRASQEQYITHLRNDIAFKVSEIRVSVAYRFCTEEARSIHENDLLAITTKAVEVIKALLNVAESDVQMLSVIPIGPIVSSIEFINKLIEKLPEVPVNYFINEVAKMSTDMLNQRQQILEQGLEQYWQTFVFPITAMLLKILQTFNIEVFVNGSLLCRCFELLTNLWSSPFTQSCSQYNQSLVMLYDQLFETVVQKQMKPNYDRINTMLSKGQSYISALIGYNTLELGSYQTVDEVRARATGNPEMFFGQLDAPEIAVEIYKESQNSQRFYDDMRDVARNFSYCLRTIIANFIDNAILISSLPVHKISVLFPLQTLSRFQGAVAIDGNTQNASVNMYALLTVMDVYARSTEHMKLIIDTVKILTSAFDSIDKLFLQAQTVVNQQNGITNAITIYVYDIDKGIAAYTDIFFKFFSAIVSLPGSVFEDVTLRLENFHLDLLNVDEEFRNSFINSITRGNPQMTTTFNNYYSNLDLYKTRLIGIFILILSSPSLIASDAYRQLAPFLINILSYLSTITEESSSEYKTQTVKKIETDLSASFKDLLKLPKYSDLAPVIFKLLAICLTDNLEIGNIKEVTDILDIAIESWSNPNNADDFSTKCEIIGVIETFTNTLMALNNTDPRNVQEYTAFYIDFVYKVMLEQIVSTLTKIINNSVIDVYEKTMTTIFTQGDEVTVSSFGKFTDYIVFTHAAFNFLSVFVVLDKTYPNSRFISLSTCEIMLPLCQVLANLLPYELLDAACSQMTREMPEIGFSPRPTEIIEAFFSIYDCALLFSFWIMFGNSNNFTKIAGNIKVRSIYNNNISLKSYTKEFVKCLNKNLSASTLRASVESLLSQYREEQY